MSDLDRARSDGDKTSADASGNLTVNPQVTDSVTQANLEVVAEAPAIAMGMLYQTVANATGLVLENATAGQERLDDLTQAATTAGVDQIWPEGVGAPAHQPAGTRTKRATD